VKGIFEPKREDVRGGLRKFLGEVVRILSLSLSLSLSSGSTAPLAGGLL
jgi:hypothetical protein